MNQLPERLDTRPLYNRATEALEQLIEDGQYQPGDQLPPEGELAKQMGISRATLREVLGNLESAGIITRRHGIGTFVTAPARGRLHGGLEQLLSFRALLSSAEEYELKTGWTIDTTSARTEIADLLLLEPESTLLHVEMIAALDSAPFAYLDSYLEESLVDVEALRRFEYGSLLDYLVENSTPRISYTHTNIYAISADPDVADRLEVNTGHPVLNLVETFYTDTGQPAMYSINYFLTERLDFYIVRRLIRR